MKMYLDKLASKIVLSREIVSFSSYKPNLGYYLFSVCQ